MRDGAGFVIARVEAEEEQAVLPGLIALLGDAVEGGASIGFLPPLSEEEARRYWGAVLEEVSRGGGVLLVAREVSDGRVVGTVQLGLAALPNGRHRAEVRKLLVLRSERRRGLGRALMLAVEREARACGRSLLVLDTRQGDVAERLYRALGFQEAGVIPGYARNAAGGLDGTVVFYKALETRDQPEGETGR